MRYQFLIAPMAIVAGAPAVAEDFSTLKQAQAILFPGARFTPADVTLNEVQVARLIEESQATVFHSKIKAWKVSTGGWFILDQAPGRDDIITYAVGLDDKGAVTGIEVMVCAKGYEEVRNSKWLDLFKGKQRETATDLPTAIPYITGATLSSTHITVGVRRVVTAFGLFMMTPG